MKAVLQFDAPPVFRERLIDSAPSWLSVEVVPETDKARFSRTMAEAEILLHVLEPVTAAVIGAAPRLRLIQKIGVGVNTIDLDAAKRRNIAVANMPGTNSRAVAELTLLLMLSALRRLATIDPATRQGCGWSLDRAIFDSVGELGGKTVGFVGFGAVPKLVAPACAALGARIVYTAHSAKSDAPWSFLPLQRLLEDADIVSLHAPLTPDTARMIDGAAIARMKSGAILVNTARGGLVDEEALIAALKSGRLGAAGLDVFSVEPAPASNPLFALDNVVVSPHVAWLTPETLQRSFTVAFENCRRIRDGEALLNRVV